MPLTVRTSGLRPAPRSSPPVHVLIVDDMPAKRVALRASLAPLGYSITEVESGVDALRAVMARDYAVILLDVQMPLMDGYETAIRIRERPRSEMTPIIFVTAHRRDEVRTDLYSGGAVDVMYAPVAPGELRAKVAVFANLFVRAAELASRTSEVQASADQLRTLTDSAPIGIFQTDADNRYVYTNPRWSEITMISAAEASGQRWDTIISPAEPALAASQPPEGSAEWAALTHRFELKSQGARLVDLTSRPLLDGTGRIGGWVGTLADVTAEASVEAAMADARDKATEASQLKSDFLAHMSHEIRTPMNGVIGMTDLLLATDMDAEQRDYVQTVRDSGEALMVVINNILDFSKIEAGMCALDNGEFSPLTVVEDVVDLLAESASTKGIQLRMSADDSIPPFVVGDAGRLRQVLVNFVGNAVKFTSAGEVVVRVGEVEQVGEQTVVRVEVSDTGDGIAAQDLHSIFQPFVQADPSISRRYGGTGLGLAISRQLVTLMGGECGVTSELGEGSTFWFTIAVGAAQAGPARAPVPAAPASAPASGRLLLAEDNLTNQKVAVAVLSKAGYQVDTVPDGAAAVEAFVDNFYDAILMDCQMPELNGYEATVAIRAKEGSGRRVPIIAMTAGALDADRERCLASGMDAYLAKPVRKDALLALVARTIRGRPAVTAPPSPTTRSSQEAA